MQQQKNDHLISKRHTITAIMIGLAVMLVTSSAHAIYVDFADYRGTDPGNSMTFEAGGQSITIAASPSDYDLRFTRSGAGVACTGSRLECFGNSSSQIDFNEEISITFNDGPVLLNSVELSRFYYGERAVLETDDTTTEVRGTGWRNRSGNRDVDFGGIVVTQLTISSRGWFSDAALRGLDFSLASATTGSGSNPSAPVPEPHAALLFGAGIALIAGRRAAR